MDGHGWPYPSLGLDSFDTLGVFRSFVIHNLTRHKISDRWRERAWLLLNSGSHRKLERGTASGSLQRLVRLWFHPVTEHSEKYPPKLPDHSVKARPAPRKVHVQIQRPRSHLP